MAQRSHTIWVAISGEKPLAAGESD